jgi:hypothetical protein
MAALRAARVPAAATETGSNAAGPTGAAGVTGLQWNSEAGSAAATRLRELAAWCDTHSEQAKDAARACYTAADNYSRAKATIPTPQALRYAR